jgi:serine/threonine protein kinase
MTLDPPAVPTRPRPGTSIAGRYTLVRELGRGTSGRVWEAVDERLERSVALKMIEPQRSAEPELRERFRREALATARLRHENVASIFDVADEGVFDVLVMEMIDGPSLGELLVGRRLDSHVASAVGVQLAAGLESAHREGFIHRDVKPANVLVRRPEGSLALIDFGVARALDATRMTADDITVGTARYIAPEQVEGRPAGPAADVYALGLLLWEAVSGRPAFEGDSVAAVAVARLTRTPPRLEDVDRRLADVVQVATRRDPAERFGSAAAGVEALTPVAGTRPWLATRTLLGEDG